MWNVRDCKRVRGKENVEEHVTLEHGDCRAERNTAKKKKKEEKKKRYNTEYTD